MLSYVTGPVRFGCHHQCCHQHRQHDTLGSLGFGSSSRLPSLRHLTPNIFSCRKIELVFKINVRDRSGHGVLLDRQESISLTTVRAIKVKLLCPQVSNDFHDSTSIDRQRPRFQRHYDDLKICVTWQGQFAAIKTMDLLLENYLL